jgi:hypothetical protein
MLVAALASTACGRTESARADGAQATTRDARAATTSDFDDMIGPGLLGSVDTVFTWLDPRPDTDGARLYAAQYPEATTPENFAVVMIRVAPHRDTGAGVNVDSAWAALRADSAQRAALRGVARSVTERIDGFGPGGSAFSIDATTLDGRFDLTVGYTERLKADTPAPDIALKEVLVRLLQRYAATHGTTT